MSKAEGILLLVKQAMRNGETQEQLQTLLTEFYRLIPHRAAVAEKVSLSLLAKKEDLCQVSLCTLGFSLHFVGTGERDLSHLTEITLDHKIWLSRFLKNKQLSHLGVIEVLTEVT